MTDETHFRVGDISIDLGRGRVMRGDTEIALPKLSYNMLLVLTRAAPNLLSIDALGEAVWPRLVVSPETVSQRVKLLRDALGDDPKAPRYIGGLRGRGYQIVAPVEKVLVEPPVPLNSKTSVEAQPTNSAAPADVVAPVDVSAPLPAALSSSAPQATAAPTPAKPVSLPYAFREYLGTRPGVAVSIALLIASLIAATMLLSGPQANRTTVATQQKAPEAPFTPPPHSVAVLSFVNMSGDEKDEYFSDGLAEELLHSLVRINQLQVAARTSSFSFKGTAADIHTIGRKLNVGAVLEGSVRKSGERVRITAQLINAATGFHLWSETYDRDLKDVFSLQTEIATAVAGALEITLLGDAMQRLSDGGTTNPEAFDAYLRAGQAVIQTTEEPNLRAGIALFDEAIAKDPSFALAHARRAEALANFANCCTGTREKEKQELLAQAKAAADRAIALAPTSGQAYGSLGVVLAITGIDFSAIEAAYRKGLALEPGNSDLQAEYSRLAVDFGRPDALAAANRAVRLNPLDSYTHSSRGGVLYFLRRYDEARVSHREAIRLLDEGFNRGWMGLTELASGRPAAALPFCEPDKDMWYGQQCLAIAYHQLGRKAEAVEMLRKMKAESGDSAAYQIAAVYAQWGEEGESLKWLTTAVRMQDPGLGDIKVDPFVDALRDTPQFREIVESLNFPQ